MKKKNKWTVAKIVKAAGKCKNRSEFQNRHSAGYAKASRMDMLEDLFGPIVTAPRGGGKRYWTDKLLHATAAKYKTRKDFRVCEPGAYMAAYMYNLLDEICTHMPKRIPWVKKRINEDLIKAAAGESMTLHEFKAQYSGAFGNATRYGLLPEIQQDMKARRKALEDKDEEN